jgi:hypothetical protein
VEFSDLTAAGVAWECRPELGAVEAALREALTAEDAERAERGLKGRKLVEKDYSWARIARAVFEACV